MKKFNKFLAMLLCAVMIVGVMPFVANENNDVHAISAEDNDVQGVVQGPNDGVLIVTGNASFDNISKAVAGNKVNSNGNSNGDAFDRIIVLFLYSKSMGNNDLAFKTGLTGNENIVWTHKCTLTKTNYVWELSAKDAPITPTTRSAGLYNGYNALNTNYKLTFINAEAKFIRFGCNMEWNYLNVHFPQADPLIYCDGRNFTVRENVNFTHGASGNWPIVLNGTYNGSKEVPNGQDKINLDQTIMLLGGEYKYVAPRVRKSDSEIVATGSINIVLGRIKIAGSMGENDYNQNAIMAFETYDENTTINYTINGTYFESPLYILGGKQLSSAASTSSAPVAAGVINLVINDGYFNKGIRSKLISPEGSKIRESVVSDSGLEINVTVNNFRGNGCIDIEGGEVDGITSRAFYNAALVKPDIITNSDSVNVVASSSVCDDQHVYVASLESGIPVHICAVCGEDDPEFKLNNGKPVVYMDSVKGRETAIGVYSTAPFCYLTEAYSKLAEWGVGGTIVIIGPSLTKGNTVLPSAGGEVTITSNFETDYRETNDACFVFVHYVKFYDDLKFDNLNIVETDNVKTIFLNFKNFTVTDTCGFYENKGSHTLANPPATKADGESTESRECKIAVITGASFSDAANEGKDIIFGTQRINLEAGNWFRIAVGSKKHTNGVYHNAENSGSTGCIGNVIVSVGSKAKVTAIDTITSGDNDINVNVVFDNRMDFAFYTGDGEPVSGKVGVYVNTDATEEIVAVVDSDFFGYEGVQHKVAVDGYGDVGVRATYTIDKDADTNGVVEFGTLITPQVDYETYGIGYIRSTAYYGVDTLNTNNLYLGNTAKSLAYLQNKEQVKADVANYELAAGQENATFRGTLVFDGATASNVNAIFAFAPYAVVKGNGGNYAVIGTVTENVTLNPNNP